MVGKKRTTDEDIKNYMKENNVTDEEFNDTLGRILDCKFDKRLFDLDEIIEKYDIMLDEELYDKIKKSKNVGVSLLPVDLRTRVLIWIDLCIAEKTKKSCPRCGNICKKEDNYCMYCGQKL